ncbi:MAG: hypothetical protein AB7O62_03990 [Pirellulales bacterium]
MKFSLPSFALLLCSAAFAHSTAWAGGPGCASCNGGGVGYAPASLHWGVPADMSYGQLAPTDWNAPASRSGCCGRSQRDMCDWWAGYCETQRVAPCSTGDCNYGKCGWGQGYWGASIASGFHRAGHNLGHGCGSGCCAPKCCAPKCCAPACQPACDDCRAPACGSGCCGGSGLGGFFGGLFGGGRCCCNAIGGSSGTAYCGGCCQDSCCPAPCCNKAPCRARLTWNGGCCNQGGCQGGGYDQLPATANEAGAANDSYYHDAGKISAPANQAVQEDDSEYAPALESLPAPAKASEPSRIPVPTPALRPAPEARLPGKQTAPPEEIEESAPALNNANTTLDDAASDEKESN